MTNKQIVALSIDKVQTFLFEVVHAHVQEKQTEDATLQNIKKSSHEISIGFVNEIKEYFPEQIINELLACSGVFIFECTLPPNVIENRLNCLFLRYYRNSQGQKLLKYTCFPRDENSEITAIQNAKDRLKRSKCSNKSIKDNRDILFFFQEVSPPGKDVAIKADNQPLFAKGINELYSKEEQSKKHSYKENHFRIAVIKADLDGMGSMFRKVKDYDTYRKISNVLNEHVSLNGLHNIARGCWPGNQNACLFPFYIAGDDIFFAVSVANLTRGIDVCRKIVLSINEALNGITSEKLSMSIGVAITFNREPIRYYLDIVETQLKNAKSSKSEALEEFTQTKISIGGLTFYDIDLKKKKAVKSDLSKVGRKDGKIYYLKQNKKNEINRAELECPIWQYFLHNLMYLNEINKNPNIKIGNPSFFYSLLERLTEKEVQENDMKYINTLLYHLLPEHLDSSDVRLRESELLLKTEIIKQIYQKDRIKSKGDRAVLNSDTKKRLETYLRLLLLFSDERFNVPETTDKKSSKESDNEDMNGVEKHLMKKPAGYLYESMLQNSLLDIFVLRPTYTRKINGKDRELQYFRLLRIEKSMFIRLRNTEKVTVEKAADMIELSNPHSFEEVEEANEERRKNGKLPVRLFFDKKEFCRRAKPMREFGEEISKEWTSDFIDSLMLLYEYDNCRLRFNGLYSKKPKEVKDNE